MLFFFDKKKMMIYEQNMIRMIQMIYIAIGNNLNNFYLYLDKFTNKLY